MGLYAGRICKLAVIFVLLAYYIGLAWYWIAEILQDMIVGVDDTSFYKVKRDKFGGPIKDSNDTEQGHLREILISGYWSVTTLSTVGFGDYYPATPFERLVGTIVIFGGYLVFSVVNGTLLNTIEEVSAVFEEFGDHSQLERFFDTLRYFNNDVPFDRDLRNKFSDFFERKWKTDVQ